MKESFKTRMMRAGLNFFPAFRRTGGRITFISHDMKLVRVQVPLKWTTKNIVGTIYGGSMYGAIDPIYMVMFIKLLGKGYIVWDKAAKIEYKRPGTNVLHAECVISDAVLDEIRSALEQERNITRDFVIDMIDNKGKVCAKIEKTLYFQKR